MKTLLLIWLAAASACGQCTLWNQNATVCGSVYAVSWQASHAYALYNMILDSGGHVQQVSTPGTSGSTAPATWNHSGGTTVDGGVYWVDQGLGETPSLGAFLSFAKPSFRNILAGVANYPQPKITLAAQNWPGAGEVLASNEATFGPQIKPYSILMAAAGITTQDYFVWQYAMASSYEYSVIQSGVSGQTNIPGDCSSAQTHPGYITYLEVPKAGSGPRCKALSYYDYAFANMYANGWTLRTGTSTMTDFLVACFAGNSATPLATNPWTPGTIASPIVTEAQYESCALPLQKAEVARWAHIDSMQIFQEPTAGMAAEQVFSTADVSTFIQHAYAALKAINGSALLGASLSGYSYPASLDTAYLADWKNSSGSTIGSLDYYALDIFSGSYDLSASNGQFTGLYYPGELTAWSTNYIAPLLATGKPVHIGQTGSPMWCPTGGIEAGAASTSYAFLGQDDVFWDTSGYFNAWMQAFVPWASAQGIKSVSIFDSLPLFYYSSDQTDDNPLTESGVAAMANLAATDSAATYKMLGNWSAESMQGNAHLSGNAHLGR